MTRLSGMLLLLAALGTAASPAMAQVKFTKCISEAEAAVEQLVHHGVFLREGGNRCEEYRPGTAKMFKAFDDKFGQRLASQTAKRSRMFTKQFKDKADQVRTYFDGRLVTYHRHFPLTVAYCENVEKLLKEVERGGWGAFTKQAKVVQSQVLRDYRICQ